MSGRKELGVKTEEIGVELAGVTWISIPSPYKKIQASIACMKPVTGDNKSLGLHWLAILTACNPSLEAIKSWNSIG